MSDYLSEAQARKSQEAIDEDTPIIIRKRKGVVDPKDYQETHWERLELERRLGN